jgi:hypothetical protein
MHAHYRVALTLFLYRDAINEMECHVLLEFSASRRFFAKWQKILNLLNHSN